MTLQQLKYVTTIANIGSISEAAKRLFVSQPSLTKAIKELPYLKKGNASSAMRAKCWSKQPF